MPLVINASCETQKFVVHGNHFVLDPGKIKLFQETTAHYIAGDRRHLGLIVLPERFEDPEYARSDEGIKELARLKAEGIANRIRHLKQIIYNNQVALKQDLEKANLKIDCRALASDGEIMAYEELAKYQDKEEDKAAERMARVEALEKKVGKVERS